MPYHAHAPVALLAAGLVAGRVASQRLGSDLRGAQRFLHCHVHRVELMVARHFLRQLTAAFVFEHDEVPQEVEEAAPLEHSPQHNLQLGQASRRVASPRDRAPGLEPFAPRGERPDARLHAVGNDQRGIGGEERRNLRLISLELLIRAPDGGVLVGRILQLDHRERQAVYKHHHIRAARVLPIGHRKLVHDEPVVVVRCGEVEHSRLRAGDGAIFAPIFHGDAIDQHAVHCAVAFQERRRVGPRELAIGVLNRLSRQLGIEARERLAQAAFQHHVAVVGVAAFGAGHAHCDVGAVQDSVTE